MDGTRGYMLCGFSSTGSTHTCEICCSLSCLCVHGVIHGGRNMRLNLTRLRRPPLWTRTAGSLCKLLKRAHDHLYLSGHKLLIWTSGEHIICHHGNTEFGSGHNAEERMGLLSRRRRRRELMYLGRFVSLHGE